MSKPNPKVVAPNPDVLTPNRAERRHPRWATIRQTAEYLGCHDWTVRQHIAAGDYTGYRAGARTVRIDLNEVDDWVKSRAFGGAV